MVATKTLYVDEFYMVTLRNKLDFVHLIYLPFKPFAPTAWAVIFGVAIVTILATNYMENNRNQFKYKKRSNKSCLARAWGIIYDTIRGLTSGFITRDSDATSSEKTLLIGFSVFVLILLTAYTASSAAALIVGGGVGK